ncbi:MAG: SpoIIE family protein phosphatase [Stenomitos rutilans HA7619-LM2]|jgi:sigma-B regulation protein RsbU (phosphoserine phosphatase)|nr:SpoIIE family protein phosphatase [Stenomitos rutilans HA7619-LM2]
MPQILIIDDDPFIQLMLKRLLQAQGYDILSALNGEDGITQAHNHHPALIICDWQMPNMDGLSVCRAIKTNPALAKTFFILLTARSEIADRVKGLDTGADDFLSKPLEPNELKARVRAGLRLYQASQDLQALAEDLQTQKQALEAELTEAADYVKSILPAPISGSIAITPRFLPSRQLGGDCFDYYWLDPDYLMFYLLDVSGHGLGSALLSVAVQNVLRSQSLPGVSFYQPHLVLKALNEIFQMEKQNNRYFTIWYGIYNQRKRQLTYASAGHPPAVLVPTVSISEAAAASDVKQLRTRGKPIGMVPDAKYVSESYVIDRPSTLYLFSDGIYEIRQHNDTFWTLADFIALLTKHSATTTANPDAILEQVQAVSGRTTFEDDCSLLQVQLD